VSARVRQIGAPSQDTLLRPRRAAGAGGGAVARPKAFTRWRNGIRTTLETDTRNITGHLKVPSGDGRRPRPPDVFEAKHALVALEDNR
jgi:hypothetical protein